MYCICMYMYTTHPADPSPLATRYSRVAHSASLASSVCILLRGQSSRASALFDIRRQRRQAVSVQ